MALPTTKNPELQAALERGETLPAEWYTDKDLFRLEQKRIFRRTWQYVGLTEQVAQPGDFFTFTIDTVPIVLTRDLNGQLRGFVNVCRHRGSQLVLDECGHRNTLQCHYHAWTYNLDGSLRAAPGSKNEPDFKKEDITLIPVHVETWGPFIFVNLDTLAQPLHKVFRTFPGKIRSFCGR